jgi:hypothetical protein
VAQVECLAELVKALVEQALAEQGVVAFGSTEFPAQTMERNRGAWTSRLRFAKNVFQDRNI